MDAIYLSLIVALFALLIVLVNGCARLMRRTSHSSASTAPLSADPVDA